MAQEEVIYYSYLTPVIHSYPMAMSGKFSKRERALMRQLAAEAHEQELEEALTELYEEFCTWGDKGMSAFDLNDKIHKFHDGISRELYKTYVMSPPEIAFAVGLSRRAINPSSVDEGLVKKMFPEGIEKD